MRNQTSYKPLDLDKERPIDLARGIFSRSIPSPGVGVVVGDGLCTTLDLNFYSSTKLAHYPIPVSVPLSLASLNLPDNHQIYSIRLKQLYAYLLQ